VRRDGLGDRAGGQFYSADRLLKVENPGDQVIMEEDLQEECSSRRASRDGGLWNLHPREERLRKNEFSLA
jgi:hypothetical protein